MKNIDFIKGNGLVPAIMQDYKTNDVLMLGYMNKEAFGKTVQDGFVWFWSRSKKRLWRKGETSGNTLKVKEIFCDCDLDALLIKVEVLGTAVCHKGTRSCFTLSFPCKSEESRNYLYRSASWRMTKEK